MPSDLIFRLNYDLIDAYTISVTPSSFDIVDPAGRRVTLGAVYKCYLRKFHRRITGNPEEKYADDELWYVLQSIIRQLWSAGRLVLVEPGAESFRLDKLTQLRLASEHFRLPDWRFSYRRPIELPSEVVVKSLSRGKIGDKVMNANKVSSTSLGLDWPWFHQELIDATHDITVVYVRGKLFPYRLSRKEMVGRGRIDWKSDRAIDSLQAWSHFDLGPAESAAIGALMQQMRLDFGRLDFLMKEDGSLVFLEVNPNGQFAWLDLDDRQGVITAICDEISPVTPRHSLQFNPFQQSE